MLNSFRGRLGMYLARFRFRAVRDPVLSVRSALTTARTVIIILPFDSEQVPPLLEFTDALKARFAQERITIVVTEHHYDIGRLLPRGRVIRVSARDLNPLFIPRRSVIAAVTARQYDLAIDMNLDFVMPSGYICRVSGARIRLGYDRTGAEHFFNIIIRRSSGAGRERSYHRLTEIVRTFGGGTRE